MGADDQQLELLGALEALGGAGSGESEIRRYVLENDLVEAIIGLPTAMFYNTGISTYIWILSNRKPPERKGKVQLIDASSFWQKMRKSLGSRNDRGAEWLSTRRFKAGLSNFDGLYRPLVNAWQKIDNGCPAPRLLSKGGRP